MTNLLLSVATIELVNHLQIKKMSDQTIRGYKTDLRMLDRYLSSKYNCPAYIEDLTTDDIESYLEMLQIEKNYAVASINRHLNSIRSLCHYAYKKGQVREDASLQIDSLKREHKERSYLSEKKLPQLVDAIDHPLIQLAVRTMAYSGMRVSECTKLNLQDLDLENDLIYVIEGKGKKDRTIPLSQTLKPYLIDYVQNWRVSTSSNRFFVTKKTDGLSPQYINRVLRDTTKKLGWGRITCHVMRHTFASNLVAKNVNIVKISKLLGHADVRTTSIYTHSNQKDLSDAVNLLQ